MDSTTYAGQGRWHRPLLYFTAVMMLSTLVAIVGLLVDDRTLVGAPIWAKPLKFSISLVLYCATWSWLLSLQRRFRRTGWWMGTITTVMVAVEMAIIIGQTVRGHRSHFNASNDVDQVLWIAMGTSITVLFVVNLVWTLLLWREDLGDRSITAAIRSGAVLSLIGLGLAYLMVGPTVEQIEAMSNGARTFIGAHSVGVSDGGPGLPLLGWSTTGGDLRIPHFVGMHAVQAIPLLSALLAWLGTRVAMLRPVVRRTRLVRVAAGGYAGLIALVTWQALRGQPIVAPDVLTVAAMAALVLSVGAGVVWSLGRGAADETPQTPAGRSGRPAVAASAGRRGPLARHI